MISLLCSIFVICLVAMPQIANVYFANAAYYFILLCKKSLKYNKNAFGFLFALITIYIVSVFHYALVLKGSLNLRFLVSTAFTIQYFVLCTEININKKKFEREFVIFSGILSMVIIAMFFLKKVYASALIFYVHNRMWGEGIFWGWPNGTGLPLLFALFLLFRDGSKLLDDWCIKALLVLGILLTTSRTTLLGAGLIVLFYIIYPKRGLIRSYFQERIWIFILFLVAVMVVATKVSIGEDLSSRLLYAQDRLDIFSIVMQLMKKSPILGFGGTTIDTAASLFNIPCYTTHTHNFVFELLIRYGSLGFLAFVGILISIYKKITSVDNKMMFILMWFLALFQIYVRDFCFLFLVSYLCYSDNQTESQD